MNQIDENKRKQVLMPDLIIIDGGKQQLNMAILALNDLNLWDKACKNSVNQLILIEFFIKINCDALAFDI